MRIKFRRDFPYHIPEHKGRSTIQYKAGRTYSVRRDCGEAAIAGNFGEEVKGRREKRQEADESRPAS